MVESDKLGMESANLNSARYSTIGFIIIEYDFTSRMNQEIHRRRYLAGVTAGSVGTFALSTEISRAVGNSWAQPNEPQFSDDYKKGWSRGTFNQPVTSNTITEIQTRILDNVKESTDKDGAVVIDPDAEPNARNKNKKRILGFAFKWRDSSAHIYAYEEPEVYGYRQLSTEQKRKEEKNAHNKIQEFVNNGGED